jgi:hypothetical protein
MSTPRVAQVGAGPISVRVRLAIPRYAQLSAGNISVYLHGATFLLAIGVCACCAKLMWAWSNNFFFFHEIKLNIVTSVYTWLMALYVITTSVYVHKFYNIYAHLALLVLATIFWLSAFASLSTWLSSYRYLYMQWEESYEPPPPDYYVADVEFRYHSGASGNLLESC